MIYILEDDDNIRQMESYAFKNSGYQVAECRTGAELRTMCEQQLPELIILDLMLPGEDGLSILRWLRAESATEKVPVIIVSAKSTELDTVKGLDYGADDYITKPFGVMELISRAKAVLRRTEPRPADQQMAVGEITLDESRRRVTAADEVCVLTFKEYELLRYLMYNHNIVLSREKIMDKVWGIDFAGESRTVDMHIKTLRQKLGGCGSQIKTVRNVGYMIEE